MTKYVAWSYVHEVTGKPRVTVWRWMRDGHFPKSRKLGPNSVGWVKSEVDEWAQSREVACA